jgi:hypothetical protein
VISNLRSDQTNCLWLHKIAVGILGAIFFWRSKSCVRNVLTILWIDHISHNEYLTWHAGNSAVLLCDWVRMDSTRMIRNIGWLINWYIYKPRFPKTLYSILICSVFYALSRCIKCINRLTNAHMMQLYVIG